jgi:Transglutaminase-like superfamily
MGRVRSFASLRPGDRRRFLVAVPVVAVVRTALWVLPFGTIRSAIERHVRSRPASSKPSPDVSDRIAWSIGSAARIVPRATCLTQALAGEVLLRRAGYPAEVKIGVAKGPTGKLEAHAWVESDGRIVIGDHDLHRFTTLGSDEPA